MKNCRTVFMMLLTGCVGLWSIQPVTAGQLTIRTIIESAADSSCLEYRPVGICVWLDCGLTGCHFRQSLQISHFRPDAVVTVFTGESPWPYVRSLQRGLSSALSLGGGHPESGAGTLNYFDVDITGSPALDSLVLVDDLLCPASVASRKSYYSSVADFAQWRQTVNTLLPEVTPILEDRFIGTVDDYWGALFPRQGFIVHSDSRRASAVIAQRAADIVTRTGQNHIYRLLQSDCGKGCRGPQPVSEKQPADHKWQLLYPERSRCGHFGRDLSTIATLRDSRDQYGWHLWRRYTCCLPRGQRLVSVLPLPVFR